MNKNVYLTLHDNDDENYRDAVNEVFKHYKAYAKRDKYFGLVNITLNNYSLENVLEVLRPYDDLFEIELNFEEDGYTVRVRMFENPLYKQRPNDF